MVSKKAGAGENIAHHKANLILDLRLVRFLQSVDGGSPN